MNEASTNKMSDFSVSKVGDFLIKLSYDSEYEFTNNGVKGHINSSGQEYQWVSPEVYDKLSDIELHCEIGQDCNDECDSILAEVELTLITDEYLIDTVRKLGTKLFSSTEIELLDETGNNIDSDEEEDDEDESDDDDDDDDDEDNSDEDL